MKTLILISGRAGSGKDTSANIIMKYLSNLGYIVRSLALADKLKYMARDYLRFFRNTDLPMDMFYSDKKNENISELVELDMNKRPFCIRTILQYLGQDMRDTFGNDILSQHVMNEIDKDENAQIFIITDIRYKNEIEYFTRQKFDNIYSFKVIRDDTITSGYDNHESEVQVSQIHTDYILSNRSGIIDLTREIEHILNSIFICYYIDHDEVLKQRPKLDIKKFNERSSSFL